MSGLILRADARQIPLADRSIDCVVTSPPYYGLRDYGIAPSIWDAAPDCSHEWIEKRWYTEQSASSETAEAFSKAGPANAERLKKARWREAGECLRCGAWRGVLGMEPTPELYIQHIVGIFREVRRVLRDDGTLWLNLGDSYANDGKWGGATGGKHVAALHGEPVGRIKRHTGLKAKDLIGIPWAVAFALRDDGWYLRSEIIWWKDNPMPESVTDRPTRAHEQLFLLAKSERYVFDAEAVKEPNTAEMQRRAEAGHTRGGNGKLDESRCDANSLRGEHAKAITVTGRNIRSVWKIATQGYPDYLCRTCSRIFHGKKQHGCAEPEWESHFAVFPEEFVRTCLLAGCPPPGIVFDPFSGSGTVARVAEKLNRTWIAADLKYQRHAAHRTTEVQKELMLTTTEEV